MQAALLDWDIVVRIAVNRQNRREGEVRRIHIVVVGSQCRLQDPHQRWVYKVVGPPVRHMYQMRSA